MKLHGKCIKTLQFPRPVSHEIEVGSAAGGQLVEQNEGDFSALVALALGQGYSLELRHVTRERTKGG